MHPIRFTPTTLLLISVLLLPAPALQAQYNYDQYPFYVVKKEAQTPNAAMPVIMPNGELWLGSYDDGIFKWENGYLQPVPEPIKPPTKHRLISTDKFGNVWFQMANKWAGRITGDSIIYYKNRSGLWTYPLEAGLALFLQNDSLYLPHPDQTWELIGRKPHDSFLALNLSHQPAIVYTVPDSLKKNIPRFFRRELPGRPVALDVSRFARYLTRETVLQAVLDQDTYVLSAAKNNQLLLISAGKVVWSHTAEVKWLNYTTDGQNFWALEQCNEKSPVRVYRLWEWQPGGFKPYTFKLLNESGNFGSVAKDWAGNLWFSTPENLYRLFPSVQLYGADESIPENIWSVVEDRRRRLYLASFGDNFAILDHGKAIPLPPLLRQFSRWMVGANVINDQVWVPNAGNFGIARITDVLQADTILSGHIFYYLKQNRDKSIVAGSHKSGLFYLSPGLDPKITRNWRIVNAGKHQEMKNVRAVTQDTFGRIWCLDRQEGIAVYDPRTDTARTWQSGNKDEQPGFGGCALETDSWGNIWLGTNEGLCLYRPALQPFQPARDLLPVLPKLFHGLPVVAIRQKGPDTLLIASEKALFILDLRYFYQHGGADDPVHAVRGRTLDVLNSGLQSGAGQNGIFSATDDRIFLTSEQGLQCLLPRDLSAVQEKQYLKIDKIALIDKNDVEEIDVRQPSVRLPFNRRLIRFVLHSWSNLHYYPDSIRLVIDGKIRKTIPFVPGSLQVIDYHFDLPLSYDVRFLALRHGEVLASTGLVLYVNLGLGELLGLLIALVATAGIFYLSKRARLRMQLEKTSFESASLQFQLLAFANQLEPHFLKNVLQPIQGRVFRSDPPLADSLSDLSEMLQLLVNLGKQATPGIHTLAEELLLTRKYLQIQLRLYTTDKFEFELPEQSVIDKFGQLRIPVMSIQLFVENAFIHGIEPLTSGGRIRISIEDLDTFVRISVDDNGVGTEKSQELDRSKGIVHTSRGMVLMRKLFEILNTHNRHPIHFQSIEKSKTGRGPGVLVQINVPKKFQFETLTG